MRLMAPSSFSCAFPSILSSLYFSSFPSLTTFPQPVEVLGLRSLPFGKPDKLHVNKYSLVDVAMVISPLAAVVMSWRWTWEQVCIRQLKPLSWPSGTLSLALFLSHLDFFFIRKDLFLSLLAAQVHCFLLQLV